MSRSPASHLPGVLSVLILATTLGSGAAFAARCPSLTIVLERSGSMLWDLAGHPIVPDPNLQRWGIAKAAIERAVAAYNNRLPLGLTLFPSDNLCGSGESLRVPPAYDTQAAISAALADSDSSPDGGGIPTCGAIQRTAAALSSLPGDSYLLLVTDGLPTCDATCRINAQDPAASTVAAIAAASMGNHPVKTFVLGLGSLQGTARTGLTRMADAGGVPDVNNPMLKFFSGNDVAALDSVIERIMGSLLKDGTGMLCDDSCLKTGCADPGQLCFHDRCVADPCRALSCRAGEYCLSAGSSAKCAAPCDKSCPVGSRCHQGACVHDACSERCAPGSKCAALPPGLSGSCVPDPACLTVKCSANQACIAGSCHDDPCQFTRCPSGLACVAFDGSCVAMALLPTEPGGSDQLGAGCAISESASRRGAVSGSGLFLLIGLVLLARRRRSPVLPAG